MKFMCISFLLFNLSFCLVNAGKIVKDCSFFHWKMDWQSARSTCEMEDKQLLCYKSKKELDEITGTIRLPDNGDAELEMWLSGKNCSEPQVMDECLILHIRKTDTRMWHYFRQECTESYPFFCCVKDSEDTVENANKYVDEVLNNLRNESWVVSKIDPLSIPGANHTDFEMRDVQITGLSNLYRRGNCTLDYDGKTVNASAQIVVRDVNIHVKYSAKALFFWIKGDADVQVDDLAVRMDISGRDGNATLESFKVTSLGEYKIKKITGVRVVLHWLYNRIASSLAKNCQEKIIVAMEEEVANAVGDLLEKHQLPNLRN